MRWTLIFQEFDYTLEHRKAERMRHVDALSRCFVVFEVLLVEGNLEKNLSVIQDKDPDIVKIRDLLLTGESKFYEMRDGLARTALS